MIKKTQKLRRNIIINLLASLILLIILGLFFFYVLRSSSNNLREIQVIKMSTMQLKSKTIELEQKIKDAKKYREIWQEIELNKKIIKSIKIDEINKILKDTSDKYNISKTDIQVILPSELNEGIFLRKTIKTLHTTGILSFEALDDTKAILFTKEFFEQLPGYVIITSFKMSKSKSYSNQDLVAISSGASSPALKVDIKFSWYTYRDKNSIGNSE